MIKIDKEKCVGCGACVSIAPENFKLDSSFKSEVINDEINDEVNEALNTCPTDAITINNTLDFKEERCIGCGACVSIAPENFKFNDEGRAEMINSSITDNVKEAADTCPVNAINID